MSSGVLVVVDRLGRPSRRFPLTYGLATIGRDPDNDIRIVLPEVVSHHATVLIHDAQAVIRSTGGGVTLVNGRAVSVAPLRHGDEISVGGRALRWEYTRPRTAPSHTSPVIDPVGVGKRGRSGRERRSAPGVGNTRERAVQLALEMAHRASMPGSAGGKQVAIVQPQRRDAAEHTDKTPARASPLPTRRSNYEPSTSVEVEDKSKRKSAARASPKNYLQNTTKATLWIESMKTSLRKKTPPQPPSSRRSLPTKKNTPLRMTVLKKAQSAHKPRRVIKIEAPLEIDHTKQAAIMLMTGHTPKSKLNVANKSSSKKSPSYLVKKPSPVRKTPRSTSGRSARSSKSAGSLIGATPSRGSDFAQQSANRRSKRYTSDRTVSILEISDSTQNSTGRTSNASRKSAKKSPALSTPKKSAMKDQSKKSFRKTESIKFDLSNLDNHRESEYDVGMDSIRYDSDNSEDITLRYSESSVQSPTPSPRRSIHSRSGRMLEQVGTPLSPTPVSPPRTLILESPSARRSLRGNAMVQSVLDISPMSDRTRSDLSVNTLVSDRARSRLSTNSIASDHTRPDISMTLAPDRSQSRLSANTIASDRTRLDLSETLASNRTRSRLSANADPDHTRSDLSATLASDRTRSRLSANADPDHTRSDLSPTLASDRTRSRLSANADPDRTRSDLSMTIASDRTRSRLSANADPDHTRTDLSATLASDRTRSRLSENTIASDRTKSRLSANATVASAFRTRTLSPRHNLETYSLVDLVSLDSEDATKSVYDSAESTKTTLYGTPAASRKTRSTIDPVLVGSSTPYPGRLRPTRSKSNSNAILKERVSVSTRRSKSLTTPENGQPVVVTRVHRASRSRSRIHDDLSLLDVTEPDDSSPRTSKRSRTNLSGPIDISNIDFSDKTEVGMTTPENRKSPEAEGTPVLSIRSLLDSSHGSFASTVKVSNNEREATSSGAARRSRLRLSREPAGSEDEGIITPTSAAKPSPEAVKNKHSTAKKPQSKRSIIDDLNRSDVVKQFFDSPVKRKLTQSMTEFSRKRLFDEDEDYAQVKRPTRRTLATAASAAFMETIDSKAGKNSRKRLSTKNDLTDVRGVKAMFGKTQKDDLRRITGVGKLFRKTSPKNDLTDVRGVRKMFQKKSPANDLRNVSGVKRILRASPKNDLTDVRGVRRMFKGNKKKSYQDVSGIEELFRSRDRSADAEELFDELVGRPPIKAVYSRTFSGRAPQRAPPRRRSLRVDLSIDLNNVEEWLQKELKRHLPSYEPAASRRVTMELKKLATDTVEGDAPVLARRTRYSSIKSPSGIGKKSPDKQFPVPASPVRAGRPVQRAVHSTPLKGRLQITMNASELGRVSPIAGPSREHFTQLDPDVCISTQSDVEKVVQNVKRSPRKQDLPKKMSKPYISPEKSPKRKTRNKKATESSITNTRRRRSSLVVTKKAPVMSPKVDKALTASQKQSPKAGTSRTRARVVKPAVVVTKPSPKLKSLSSTITAKPSQTESAKLTTRKVIEKKPESPKGSPRGKRKTRANVSKNEPKAKAKQTRIEDHTPVEELSQTKRARRGNQTKSKGQDQNQMNVQVERAEKRSNSRGKKVQDQKSVEPEIVEKRLNTRGKKAQPQTSVQSEKDEKKTNTRGKKVQFDIIQDKLSPRRGAKSKQEIEPKTHINAVQNLSSEEPTARTRSNKAYVTVTQSRGKRKAATEVDISTVIPPKRGKTAETPAKKASGEKKEIVSKDDKATNSKKESTTTNKKQETRTTVRATKLKTIVEPVQMETTRVRGRKDAEPKENVEPARNKRKAKVDPSPAKAGAKKAVKETISPEPAPRTRRAARGKPLLEVTQSRGKRKAATEVDISTVIPPKRGKTAETPAKKVTGKQKEIVSKDDKATNSKKESASTSKKEETRKPVRATRLKTIVEPVQMETTRVRGRKVQVEPKEKVEPASNKRKAKVDPSPAKVATKAVRGRRR